LTVEQAPVFTEAESSGARAEAGLRHGILSPIEVLAQSIGTIAPTASPTMTVPLVFALAGNGTWLAYLFAVLCVLLIALCIGYYARLSASCGSLYGYALSSRQPFVSSSAGLALVLAYVATGASVTGGFINYANVLAESAHLGHAPALVLALVAVGVSVAVAYRDIQVSAQLMLWIEVVSVASIAIVVAVLLWRAGIHLHVPQATLAGVHASGVRLGVVLALFSFVGFESATALGAEARDPLRTIPRAVLQSAVLAGVFFILCAYVEVMGFAQVHQNLGDSVSPLHVLSTLAGLPWLAPVIDIGALVSMFACTLSCVTAAARVLLRMSAQGLVHSSLGRTHARHNTPAFGAVLSGVATFLPVAAMLLRGVSGVDIYGYMGSLAVYGFITVYAIVAAQLPFFLRAHQRLSPASIALSALATLAMLAALAGTLYPVPAEPYNWLPYVYLGYLLLGLLSFRIFSGARTVPV
jgi:amino acid transporter